MFNDANTFAAAFNANDDTRRAALLGFAAMFDGDDPDAMRANAAAIDAGIAARRAAIDRAAARDNNA